MSMSPGQPRGPYGHPGMPPRQGPAEAGLRGWLSRHRYWSVAGAAVLAIGIIAAAVNKPPAKASGPPRPRPQSAVAALAQPPVACGIRVSRKHPRDHTRVTVRVRTAPHARVVLATTLALAAGSGDTGRASARGTWSRPLRVGGSAPGVRVVIAVRVASGRRAGRCQTWVRPRRAAAAATPTPSASTATAPAPGPAPTPAPTPAPAPAPAPPPPPAPSGCYPKTDGGNCYEPGEFCRDDDHGATGVAGDGEKIKCEDNDGWRWEPY
jgi:hypothetical protein